MQLPKDKQQAYDNIMEGKNVFITGVAGTGKSFLLDYIREHSGLKLSVTATTGVAAVNVGGQTIHSFAGVGLAKGDKDYVRDNINSRGQKRIKKCKVLVIDEISMMSDDLFEKLDHCFKYVKGNEKPFGGVQLVVFGDFLQLPPVKRSSGNKDKDGFEFENLFCFQTDVWKQCGFVAVELKKVYRQNEQRFIDLLNNIRIGECSEQDIKVLQECTYTPEAVPEDLKPVVLTATNARCDEINQKQLDKIDSKPKTYNAYFDGSEYKVKALIRDSKVVERLELKVGCQVMLTTNLDQLKGLVNGSLGKVVSFKNGNPMVKFDNGVIQEVGTHEWHSKEYNPDRNTLDTVATAIQIPLRLAWAITIHKSQGMTIPYIYAELHNVFTDAQVYVSLSRAKTLEGLFLAGFSPDKIKVNQIAKDFYANIDAHCAAPKAQLI